MTDYDTLAAAMDGLTSGVEHTVANLANASALIFSELPDLNWAGFYYAKGGKLVLGPFQGKPACIEIPMGSGVCGTAAAEDRPLTVPNVHEFPGHIACDCASNSEIVVPIHKDGRVVAVLDIDSPVLSRFTPEDAEGIIRLAEVIERNMVWE